MSVEGVSHLPPVVPATTPSTSSPTSPVEERARDVASTRVESSRGQLKKHLDGSTQAAVGDRKAANQRRMGRREEAAAEANRHARSQRRTGAVGRREQGRRAETFVKNETEGAIHQDSFVTAQNVASRREQVVVATGKAAVQAALERSRRSPGLDVFVPPRDASQSVEVQTAPTAKAQTERVVKMTPKQSPSPDRSGERGRYIPFPQGDVFAKRGNPEKEGEAAVATGEPDLVVDYSSLPPAFRSGYRVA